jgi:hypothetical protein
MHLRFAIDAIVAMDSKISNRKLPIACEENMVALAAITSERHYLPA